MKELVELIERTRRKVWTLAPAVILDIDYSKMRAKIKLKARVKNEKGEFVEPPEVEDCPVLPIKGGDNVVIVAPKKGDVVLALFSYHPLDGLLDTKDVADVKYERRQDVTDAIVLPGLFTLADAVPEVGEDEVLMRHASGTKVKIDKDGNVSTDVVGELTLQHASGTKITIDASGNISVDGVGDIIINQGDKGVARVGDSVSATGIGNLGIPVVSTGSITSGHEKFKA